jgi:hypothetical protein
MSSRFVNLIQSVFNRFEYDEYTLLLAEALSVAKIQDELKSKGIDIDAYNSKHHLFILSLINSNLNLDVYDRLITTIKDQGILNRLMSQTVDKRSNKPTVDFEIINKVLQNVNNLPEINSILNSVSQNREKKVDTGPKEYAEGQSPSDRNIAAASKLFKEWLYDNGLGEANEHEVAAILEKYKAIIEPFKEKYPDNRLLQNNSYLLALVYCLTKTKGDILSKKDNIEKVMNLYFAHPELMEQNVIFNSPYRDNFYKLSNYVYKYNAENSIKKKTSDSEEAELIYSDENVEVFLGTVESHQESIRRCIKYGQGPKYNFCISTRNDNYYSRYRLDPKWQYGKINLTTYFVYFKTPELISKYGANGTAPFVLIDTYTREGDDEAIDIKYQINRASPNQEIDSTKESILQEYPIFQKAFDDGIFKVKIATEAEKDYYFSRNTKVGEVNSPETLISLAKNNPLLLNYGSVLEDFYKKYPETFDYAFELLLKNRDDQFNTDFASYNAGHYEVYFSSNAILNFIKDKPEYKSMVDDYLKDKDFKNYLIKNIKLTSNLSFEQFLTLVKDFPDKVNQFIKRYIVSKKDWMDNLIEKVNPQDTEDDDGYYDEDPRDRNDIIYDILNIDKQYFGGLYDFLNSYPKYETEEVKDQIKNVKEKQINSIKNLNYITDSVVKMMRDRDYEEEKILDIVKFNLDKNLSDVIAFMENNREIMTYDTDYEKVFFYPLKDTFKKYPELKDRYKDFRLKYKIEIFKQYGIGNRIMANFKDLLDKTDETNVEAVKIGLPIYIEAKIKEITETPLVKAQLYGKYSETYNNSSQSAYDYLDFVFNYMGDEFYEQNIDIIKQYDDIRLKHKHNLINALGLRHVLDNHFFELTKKFFPEQTQEIYNYYIESKLLSLKTWFEIHKDAPSKLKSNVLKQINKGNISKFILDPIKRFNDKYPNFLENYLKMYQSTERFDQTEAYVIDYFSMFNSKLTSYEFDEVYEMIYNNKEFKNNKFKFFNNIIKEIEKEVKSKTDYHLLTVYEKVYDFLSTVDGLVDNQNKKVFDQIIESNKVKITAIISNYVLSELTKAYNYDETFFINRRSETHVLRGQIYNLLKYMYNSSSERNKKKNDPIQYIINKIINIHDVFAYINDNIKPDEKIDVKHFAQSLFPNIRLIYKDEKLKRLFYEILKKVNFSDNINMVSKHDLGLYIKLLSEYEDVSENAIYKSVIKYDNEIIEQYLETLNEYVDLELEIDGETFYRVSDRITYLPQTTYINPDLSKYIFRGKLDIAVAYNKLDTFKWLPRQVGINSTIQIHNAVLKNIDYIPLNVFKLSLNMVDLEEGFSIAPNSMTNVEFVNLNNLKHLKIFKQQKRPLSSLILKNLPNLISLEDAPVVQDGYMLLRNLPNIKSFEGLKGKQMRKIDIVDMKVRNFIGIPKAEYYMIESIVYSFKGLPASIKTLQINGLDQAKPTDMKKQFPVSEYKNFPRYIENLEINNNNVAHILFGKLHSSLPALGGRSKLNWIRYGGKFFANAYEKYVNRVRKTKDKNRSTKKRVKAVQAKRAKPLSREEEIENIEKQQDKSADREKIKRLNKEELELITPFNVLLEGIINNIVTSFKVYK